jgi:hypothetical protein
MYTFIIHQTIDWFKKFVMLFLSILFAYLSNIENTYLFSPFVVLPILLAISYQAVDFDFDNNTYKNYLWLLGLKLGKKQALPNIDYILLREAHFSVKNSDGLMDKPDIKYEVALVTEENAKIPLLFSFNYNIAQATADQASYMFKVKIKNRTL